MLSYFHCRTCFHAFLAIRLIIYAACLINLLVHPLLHLRIIQCPLLHFSVSSLHVHVVKVLLFRLIVEPFCFKLYFTLLFVGLDLRLYLWVVGTSMSLSSAVSGSIFICAGFTSHKVFISLIIMKVLSGDSSSMERSWSWFSLSSWLRAILIFSKFLFFCMFVFVIAPCHCYYFCCFVVQPFLSVVTPVICPVLSCSGL